jgi:monoamine oxidase
MAAPAGPVFAAAYKDWGHDPYGGGWNFWAPEVDVRAVMQGIRRPFAGDDLYIVGEAYSGNQGWVEGALTTAEHVLRDYFGLRPAAWQPESLYLGY